MFGLTGKRAPTWILVVEVGFNFVTEHQRGTDRGLLSVHIHVSTPESIVLLT
jgi:hypothetical protein